MRRWAAAPLAAVALAAISGSVARADSCPNAQFRTGLSANLPDCRAYELVSPSDKGGYDVIGELQSSSIALASSVIASPDGTSTVYAADGAFAGAQSNPVKNYYAAARGAASWIGEPLDAPTPQSPTYFGDGLPQYFPPGHLNQPVIVSAEPLVPGAPANVNLYLRNTDGSFPLLTTGTPPPQYLITYTNFLVYGVSADLHHVLFAALAPLTPDAPPLAPGFGSYILYDWHDGALTLVGRLPDNSVAQVPTAAGSPVGNPISTDGSRIFFATSGSTPADQQLYVRKNDSTIVEVSASQRTTPDPNGPQPAFFESATPDGSKVLFTSAAELTNNANTGSADQGRDLYQYDVGNGTLTDLTPDTADANGASVQGNQGLGTGGVVGASRGGSYVYFVAAGKLAAGATAGQPNLYVWHEGTARFVATLSPGDSNAWLTFGNYSGRQGETAYVTPDGKHLVFESISPLTGQNNVDAATGNPDTEVFSYSAASGTLTCASCDPSGARPIGNATITNTQVNQGVWQPRVMSDDGSRLFFNSPDPLVPGSANGHVKVFENENGQIRLISSGTSSSDDYFGDASSTGNDVFFITVAQLVPQDADQLVDLYDARVGGGYPPPPAPAAPCSGDACQGGLSGSPLFASPASVTFIGSGNAGPGAAAARVNVLSRIVHGSTFLVRVSVPGRGRITVTGANVRAMSRSVSAAGTYPMTVVLTPRARSALRQRHRLKLRLRIAYTPAAGIASAGAVWRVVQPALSEHRLSSTTAIRASRNTGGAR